MSASKKSMIFYGDTDNRSVKFSAVVYYNLLSLLSDTPNKKLAKRETIWEMIVSLFLRFR